MNTLKKILVTIGGVLFILMGVFHLLFWKLFDWGNELSKLSVTNSNIMQKLNIGLCILLFSFGYILLVNRKEVISTRIGKILLFVSTLFFLIRLVIEFIFPGGKLLFGIIFLICMLVYLIPAIIKDNN